jgi:hypothetical protein
VAADIHLPARCTYRNRLNEDINPAAPVVKSDFFTPFTFFRGGIL